MLPAEGRGPQDHKEVKSVNKYEAMYIVTPEMEDEAIKGVIEKFSGIITANGGEIEKTDEWGRKKLAYPIDYKTEGYYVLVNFAAAPELPRELERNFRNDESILRYMVVRQNG